MSENKSKKQEILGGIVWSYGERITAQLVSFAVSVILARMLEPEHYGVISIVMIFITFCNAVVTGGFGNAIVQKKDADELDVNTMLYCSLVTYRNMYEEKGMKGYQINKNELDAYASFDSLFITTASVDGKVVVYHSYITENTHSRLLHSCSEFRASDSETRNKIGRANKYLHWNDWLFLKERGVKYYDWGGISSSDNPNGIDKFKMSFGGNVIKYYNLWFTCSMRAKLYTHIKKEMKKH